METGTRDRTLWLNNSQSRNFPCKIWEWPQTYELYSFLTLTQMLFYLLCSGKASALPLPEVSSSSLSINQQRPKTLWHRFWHILFSGLKQGQRMNSFFFSKRRASTVVKPHVWVSWLLWHEEWNQITSQTTQGNCTYLPYSCAFSISQLLPPPKLKAQTCTVSATCTISMKHKAISQFKTCRWISTDTHLHCVQIKGLKPGQLCFIASQMSIEMD